MEHLISERENAESFSRVRSLVEDLITSSFHADTAVTPGRPETPGSSLLEYFGFTRDPFGDSLDTEFFFKSPAGETALIKMQMSIENDISFGLVYGESGTGKTILSQVIVEQMDTSRYRPVLVPATPGLSRTAFLSTILRDGFSSEVHSRDVSSMVRILSEKILSMYQQGIKPVLFIDECHFLSADALHLLRTLSNFEAHNRKIITTILFAEPQFVRRLGNPSYNSLRSRIYLDVEMKPFPPETCLDYIAFRLKKSGGDSQAVFTQEDLDKILSSSRGIPRNINKECTKILLGRYLMRRK